MEKIFDCMFLFIIALIIYGIGYVISSMWRFLVRAEAIINSFDYWKKMIEADIYSDDPTRFTYKDKVYEFQIEFNSSLELSQRVLEVIDDVLQYYNRIGYIAISVEDMCKYKDKLDGMRDEVKQLRERLQNEDPE